MTPAVRAILKKVLARLAYDASYASFDLALHAECLDPQLRADCKRALAAVDVPGERWEHIRSLVERAVGK